MAGEMSWTDGTDNNERDRKIEDLFRAESQGLRRFLLSRGADQAMVDDVVQDSFLAVYSHWEAARDHAVKYLYRVALRRWHRLSTALKKEREKLLQDSFRSGPGDGDQMDECAMSVDLDRALAALSPRQREAVILHYLRDFPIKDVAEVMGVRPGTIKALLSQARDRLAAEIGDNPLAERGDE